MKTSLPRPTIPHLKIAGRTAEEWGRLVRTIFSDYSKTRPDCRPSWLTPWDDLPEADREVDRLIGLIIAGEAAQYCRETAGPLLDQLRSELVELKEFIERGPS